MHETFVAQTGMKLSAAEECLLSFHKSNLEYSCGAPLSLVSALHWDQNEQFPQFTGHHALMITGYSKLTGALAEGLDIRFNSAVTQVRICTYSPALNYVFLEYSDGSWNT